MLASTPSQHLESDFRPSRNPTNESTFRNRALAGAATSEAEARNQEQREAGYKRRREVDTGTSSKNTAGPSHSLLRHHRDRQRERRLQ
jgi:hypothetical protein